MPLAERGAGAASSAGPLFEDAAQAAGLRFEHRNGRQGEHLFPEITGAGVALLDYDNDGDLDAYLVQAARPSTAPSPPASRSPGGRWARLFRNDLAPGRDGPPALHRRDRGQRHPRHAATARAWPWATTTTTGGRTST